MCRLVLKNLKRNSTLNGLLVTRSPEFVTSSLFFVFLSEFTDIDWREITIVANVISCMLFVVCSKQRYSDTVVGTQVVRKKTGFHGDVPRSRREAHTLHVTARLLGSAARSSCLRRKRALP